MASINFLEIVVKYISEWHYYSYSLDWTDNRTRFLLLLKLFFENIVAVYFLKLTYLKKFLFKQSNAADIHDHIKNEVQTVVKTLIDRVDDGRCDDDDKDEVKNLLSSLLDRVGDKDSKEIVKNEVQTALTSLSDQVDNTTCEKKDEVEDKVKRTLTALLDEIEDGDDVLNVVKQTVSDVMEQVALVIHTRTSTALLKVDDFMSEDWLSQVSWNFVVFV